MQYRLDVGKPSSPEWLQAVLEDFDEFLKDHADCERKASSMAMSFVAKYPDRKEILPELIDTAVEELEHFRMVYTLLAERRVALPKQMKQDAYVKALINRAHSGRNERFMDRLLIASVVETRGAERFRLIAENIMSPSLQKFYKELWTSEAKHGEVFVRMALQYFDENMVYSRLKWWMEQESAIVEKLPIQPALH